MANEPGSTESSASTGNDAEEVFHSTAEDDREGGLELPSAPPREASSSPASEDSDAPPRPSLARPSLARPLLFDRPDFFSAQAALNRSQNAFDAIDRAEDEAVVAQYAARAFPAQPYANQPPISTRAAALPIPPPAEQKQRGLFWRRRAPQALVPETQGQPPAGYSVAPTAGAEGIGFNPVDLEGMPAPHLKLWWQKQPYRAIAQLLAISGTLSGGWLFGILVAHILPGDFTQPPLQEAVLRRSSRLGQRLWHFSQLWQTPTSETRIEAIPLPETGPVLAPISLPPIERQPLIDELNSVETELLTLDRRLQTIEKRLGKPPYQGAGIENRVNSLRGAIDPPVRATASPATQAYKPTPIDPNDQLLEVAQIKITLPSDALFSPGDSELKDSELLNQVLDQLVNYPKATVIIRSYSDNQVEPKASRDYTQQQAIVLSEHLRHSLGDGYRWVTIGAGPAQPIESNDTDPGRQRNRRIEILVDTRT